MILIDNPFVSDFLIETIRKNNFQIVSTVEARDLINDKSLNWITKAEAQSKIKENPSSAIYTNSENSISWLEKNLAFSNLPKQIDIFKNKIKFRKLLSELFPNYFFKRVKYEELQNLNISKLTFPFIVKPTVGFFSIGVYKVDTPAEWKDIVNNIKSEIESIKGMYPKEVINISDFIIEGFIVGEEFAIDCYFNNDGEPIVLNIMHHLFSSAKDVSDRVYSTSEEIIMKYKSGITSFLKIIGEKVNLKNFPAHVEVRIDENGTIHPIEVNPLRFGGWCTTGDLSWYAFGFNSYEYFLKGEKPNWNEIFRTRKNKKFSIVVLDNNSCIDGEEIDSFDYNKLLSDFEKPLSLRKVNFKKYPVFGFLFLETNSGNDNELNYILKSDLRKYITIKKS